MVVSAVPLVERRASEGVAHHDRSTLSCAETCEQSVSKHHFSVKKEFLLMAQRVEHTSKPTITRVVRVGVVGLLAAGLVAALIVGLSRAQTIPIHSATTVPVGVSAPQCRASSLTERSSWTPGGVVWKLTVAFLIGSRSGQTERSVMTFARDGSLTATFPGATARTPATLPPAIDGTWCMTGANAFRYQFHDPIMRAGKMVAYVATHIEANLTSRTTFEAGGIGIAYTTATGLPIPTQYNVTQTFAVTSSQ
jgi:hypothetical protein